MTLVEQLAAFVVRTSSEEISADGSSHTKTERGTGCIFRWRMDCEKQVAGCRLTSRAFREAVRPTTGSAKKPANIGPKPVCAAPL